MIHEYGLFAFMDNAVRFKILSDPHRQLIVERLSAGPATVRQLTDALGISQPAVSHHLKLMREAELVRFEPSGASNVYSIDPAGLAAMRAWLDRHWSMALDVYQKSFNQDDNNDHDDQAGPGTPEL